MDFMTKVKRMAQNDIKTIVLPEGEEERNLTAAAEITASGIANIILLGNIEKIEQKASELGVDISKCTKLDPGGSRPSSPASLSSGVRGRPSSSSSLKA